MMSHDFELLPQHEVACKVGEEPDLLKSQWKRCRKAPGWLNDLVATVKLPFRSIHRTSPGFLLRFDGGTHSGDRDYIHTDLDGVIHREDGPARIIVDPSSQSIDREWYQRGRLHRCADLPAIVRISGRIAFLSWCVGDKLHRERGPARKAYDLFREPCLIKEVWYLDDTPCPDLGLLARAESEEKLSEEIVAAIQACTDPNSVAAIVKYFADGVAPTLRESLKALTPMRGR